jgi:hypothetical protein
MGIKNPDQFTPCQERHTRAGEETSTNAKPTDYLGTAPVVQPQPETLRIYRSQYHRDE